ncbi:MAG TPA: hypothetical protein PKI19_01500 [Elusimicrobiales bacterium]|nr:hypothetical protein [Elusimicrobiales bacterium]
MAGVIYFNKQPLAAAKNLKLADLLKRMHREAARTVVTVDGEFIAVPEYRGFIVRDGARVEAWELQDGG